MAIFILLRDDDVVDDDDDDDVEFLCRVRTKLHSNAVDYKAKPACNGEMHNKRMNICFAPR
jgi:hypothetical protein